MNEQTATCPPHHWHITTVESGATLADRYQCLRCGAAKDVAREVTVKTWPLRKPGPKRR